MTSTRRLLLSTAPLLAVAGCGAAAATAGSTPATTGALAITTVPQATTFWSTIKGVAEVAIAAVSVANPVLAATLTTAVAVGEGLLDALPGTASDAASLAGGITTLVQHGAALVSQAGANITVVSNGDAN